MGKKLIKRTLAFFSSSKGGSFALSMLEAMADEYPSEFVYSLDRSEKKGKDTLFSKLLDRWKMYGGFVLKSIRKARAGQKVSIITTNPFFNPWLVATFSKKETRTIQLLWDLFPDALENAGIVRKGSFFSRLISMITKSTFRRCDATVYLGERILQYAEARYGPSRFSVVIPVGADAEPFQDNFPTLLARNQTVSLLYCGNLGRMHDVETLVGAMLGMDDNLAHSIDIRFHASGIGYDVLRKQVGSSGCRERKFHFAGGLPGEAWVEAMKTAHVGVVTMRPGAENVVMPSKTYSCLVAGQAVLAICPRASDLADLIIRHDCGWVIEPGDVSGLLRILKKITNDPDMLFQKRRNAYEAGHKIYDSKLVARDWIDLLNRL